MCRDSWLESIRWEEVKEALNGKKDSEINSLLKLMVAENHLIRLKENRFIHEEAMAEIKKKIKGHIQLHGKITAAECKSVLGIGRRETVRILEYLDDIKFTLRIGDHRVLVKSN